MGDARDSHNLDIDWEAVWSGIDRTSSGQVANQSGALIDALFPTARLASPSIPHPRPNATLPSTPVHARGTQGYSGQPDLPNESGQAGPSRPSPSYRASYPPSDNPQYAHDHVFNDLARALYTSHSATVDVSRLQGMQNREGRPTDAARELAARLKSRKTSPMGRKQSTLPQGKCMSAKTDLD